jgi:mono/diheme cytochrome c family protein
VDVPQADRLNAGIFLIERNGCFGCHKIKGWEGLRKVGPDLTRVASKTSEEWIFRWIKEPKAFRPTRMPQIWDVRTPDQDTAERKARSNTEVNAVVAYLVDKSARVSYPDPPRGDLAAGRRLFESVGCMACHRIGDDRRGVEGIAAASFRTHGPNLDGTGSKVNAGWLYAWVRNPKGYWHETRMPNLRLSETEAADVTAYLMSLKNEAFASRERPSLDKAIRDDILLKEYLYIQYSVADAQKKLDSLGDRERTLYLGERVIARQGCFGCHEIPGFEKTAPVGTELTEEGSKLVERLDFGYLEHEIPHTLPAWVKQKLLDPRIFDRDKPAKRPEELLRMPKFFFTEEEADAIVTAVLSFSKEQIPLAAQKQLSADEKYVETGRRLVRDYNCQGCHVLGARGGAIRTIIEGQLVDQGMDPVDARLRAPALSPPTLYNETARIGEGSRVQTPWLHGFLGDPSHKIRPWLKVRMPTFSFTDEQRNTITRFFATLDKVPYPYEPAPRVEPTAVATGKLLFEKWRCVSCHVVAGKLPSQEDPAMMAPDLAEVPRRLRAEWIAQWLQDPGRIQPGTRMPANFPANAQENAYPEILGGDQAKQIDAVRAYLLTLGKGIPAAREADP